MKEQDPPRPSGEQERAGPGKDFAAFSELELERLRNSDEDFDAEVFHAAVDLVLGKIAGLAGGNGEDTEDGHQ
jgi:hypothetical protein